MEEAVEKVLGRVIRKLREDKTGLSHVNLAARFEIDKTHYGRIERGETEPGIRIIDKLAKGLGLELSELMILVDKERKKIKEGHVIKK
jgi:ribosome-binding protein aMBF1 (putative translation factor)